MAAGLQHCGTIPVPELFCALLCLCLLLQLAVLLLLLLLILVLLLLIGISIFFRLLFQQACDPGSCCCQDNGLVVSERLLEECWGQVQLLPGYTVSKLLLPETPKPLLLPALLLFARALGVAADDAAAAALLRRVCMDLLAC